MKEWKNHMKRKRYTKEFLETNPLVQKKIEVIRSFVKNHGSIWVRRALYELVSKQLIKDTSDYSYIATSRLFSDLRYYKLIPFEWFKDKKTTIDNVDIKDYGDFQARFDKLCKYYNRSSKALQKYYMEIWTEKELSEDTIAVINQYDIGLVMGEGFIGDIPFHDAEQRFHRILNEYHIPIRIIYISDYDCEGEHTFNLCKTSLEPLGDIIVTKLFLTKKQLKGLISNIGYVEKINKLKKQDKKWKAYLTKEYVKDFFANNLDLQEEGIVQYELDQIDIELMKQSLRDTISSYIDLNIISNMEETCAKEVNEWVSKHYKE